jgi:tyrosyl-tRNA synthetase
MGLVDIIKLAARKSVAQILTREDFAKRYAEGVDIRMHEILYPLLQGWDSVMIDADVEMGGSDQLFNNLVGREFQKEEGKDGQVVIVTPLLVGTDGVKKMSKSLGNYIGVTDPPYGEKGIFGKIMSLPDNLMPSYYTLLTNMPESDFIPLVLANPRDAKIQLAKQIISWLHSPADADAAEAAFKKQFVDHGEPDNMPEVSIGGPGPHKLAPLLVKAGLASSNGEAMRKMKEGAVHVAGEKVMDPAKEWTFPAAVSVRLGRKWAKLKP